MNKTDQNIKQKMISEQMVEQIAGQSGKKKTGKMIKKYLIVFWPLLVLILISLLYAIALGLAIVIVMISATVFPDLAKGNVVAVFLASRFNINTLDPMLFMIPLQLVWAAVFYHWYRRVVVIKPEITKRWLQKKNLLLLVLLAFGSNLFVSGGLDLIMPYVGNLGEEYNEMMNEFLGGNVIFVLISTLFLAPISEELICRGVIMKKAREAFPFAVANVVQALIFGVIHGNIIQGSYAFVIGLILGYIAYQFDSIMPAILMHFILNLLGGFLLFSLPVPAQIVEVVLGVGIIIYTVRMLGKHKIQQAKAIDSYSSDSTISVEQKGVTK